MKTEISRFCEVCSHSLGTLPSALDIAAGHFEQGRPQLPGSLAALHEIRARLRSLTDKLRSQQAYLLIFGPLKSGKSTLMNAVSGAYVSEVTSLPGYPCLVFVRHAAKPRYSITRYNGRESSFGGPAALTEVVTEAHHALAREIRQAEERTEEFDPRSTFPEAIRRIDIQLPVPSLAESATVLVDTPGLYSRMNFGYDVLTREFRDSAACAVFVVKTDNLFLEQVFAEFNQLLGLFSRIFIVVNVDAGKRDLAPDGSLQPSAESQSPDRVIEAFTTLSMGGPLRAAYEQGRVRIHAVDLLGAASAFLSGNEEEGGRHRTAFDAFQQDLTEYLNSSDYTKEFIRDSLRQGRTLCTETLSVLEGRELEALRGHQQTLESKLRDLDARIAAVERLQKADWAAMFSRFRDENTRGAEDANRARSAQAREEMRTGLKRWYSNSDSLASLTHLHWNPVLTDTARALAEQTRERIQRLGAGENGGLAPGVTVLADMRNAGFQTAALTKRVMNSITVEDDVAPYKTVFATETLPVRKTFLDWILFRSQAKVRRRLFGEDGTREIAPEEKTRRLVEDGRAMFESHIEDAIRARFPALPAKFSENVSDTYVKRFVAEVSAELIQLGDQLKRERAARQAPYDINARILAAAAELTQQTTRVATDLDLLAEAEAARFTQPPAPVPEAAQEYLPQTGMLPLLE
jgi:hypothetical protein